MGATMNDPNTSIHLDDFSEFYDQLNYSYIANLTNFTLDESTIPCEPVVMSRGFNITLCLFLIQVFIIAIPGNLTVGLVIVLNRLKLSPSDIYLFHLIIADTLLALILPFSATNVILGWIFGDIMCKLVHFVEEANFYTSILFLVCISVDRYMVIVRAMETRKTQRIMCTWAVCIIVWILGFILSLPALYHKVHTIGGYKPQMCSELFAIESADEWRLATRATRHILGFLLPLVVMLSCYGVTADRLLRTRGFQRQKAMKVIAAVILAFLLCWTPFHLVTMVDTLLRANLVKNDCFAQRAVTLALLITECLALLHCCINPVLYALVGEKFRKRLLHMVWKIIPVERSIISRSTSQTSEHNFL